jgi:hypothetical protein
LKTHDKLKELAFITMNKFNEVVENSIFELIQVSGCMDLSELKNKGYEIRREYCGTTSTFGLYYHNSHIMTYRIFIENEEGSLRIKRERKINNLEGGDLYC